MEPVQPTAPTPEVKKSSNFLPFVLSILLVLVCLIAGYFFWQVQTLKQEIRKLNDLASSQTHLPSESGGTSQPTTDPTADWKTYTNEKYGFSFKYPSFLQEKKYSEGSYIGIFLVSPSDYEKSTGQSLMIKTIYVPNQDALEYSQSLRLAEKNSPDFSERGAISEIKEILVGGKKAYQYEVDFMGQVTTTILPTNTNDLYRVAFYYPNGKKTQESQLYLDQILSTFHFTKN